MTTDLTEALEAAEAAMLEAAYRWLVARGVAADGEHYGDDLVWRLMSHYYPGGAQGFRFDPVGSEGYGIRSYLTKPPAPLTPAEAAAL